MNTDDLVRELGLFQLSDSFFPTGLYSTSSGLESAFLQKEVTSREGLVRFISIQITQQLGPCDCVAIANAIRLSKLGDLEPILKLDETVHAIRGVREARDASARSGAQLLRTVRKFVNNDVLSGFSDGRACTYPVAFGVCSHALGIGSEKSLLSFLYGFAVSVVGAALRLGIIQHFEGQETLHELKPVMARTVLENKDKSVPEMWQFLPQIEIGQMRHERMDSRMFVT